MTLVLGVIAGLSWAHAAIAWSGERVNPYSATLCLGLSVWLLCRT
jgi:hypothetical protein